MPMRDLFHTHSSFVGDEEKKTEFALHFGDGGGGDTNHTNARGAAPPPRRANHRNRVQVRSC